ncbi:GPC1 [Symbiodinium sp. CCMP2456]|nr:GPC1 [Symbiodinium sp. CCMP2456]
MSGEETLQQFGADKLSKGIRAIEARAAKFKEKGMTQANFAIGVANILFLAWCFGALRGYLWMIYVAEVCAMLPFRWQSFAAAKPSEVFYLTEFCWVANVALGCGFVLLATFEPSLEAQSWFFAAAWGVSTGPLLGATVLLENSMIFHDFALACSALIHVMPCMVMFEMRWGCPAVQAAWPQLQVCEAFQAIAWYDMLLATAFSWGTWAVLFMIWLLIWGLELPKQGYDTMFHASMRISGGVLAAKATGHSQEELETQREKDDYPRSYVLVHMFVHSLLNTAAALLALICSTCCQVHGLICLGILVFIINNGAKRYTYFLMGSYKDSLKSLEEPLLQSDGALEDISPNSSEKLLRSLLKVVEDQAEYLAKQSFTKTNFVLSVSNTLLISWSFGAFPGHFLLVYLLQTLMWLPCRWTAMVRAKPKEVFYLLDVGWISILCFFLWVIFLVSSSTNESQKVIFCTAWAFCNGPLLLSPAILRNAMLFHSFDQMLSAWLQLLPALAMFHLAWSRDMVEAVWPEISINDFFLSIDPLRDILSSACGFYAVWVCIYLFWFLTCGLRLARDGYDTPFHYVVRGPRGKILARFLGTQDDHAIYVETGEFPMSYVAGYICYHALLTFACFLFSLFCFLSSRVHAVTILCMVGLTIWNAAERYTFYVVRMYMDLVSSKMNVEVRRGASSLVLQS